MVANQAEPENRRKFMAHAKRRGGHPENEENKGQGCDLRQTPHWDGGWPEAQKIRIVGHLDGGEDPSFDCVASARYPRTCRPIRVRRSKTAGPRPGSGRPMRLRYPRGVDL